MEVLHDLNRLQQHIPLECKGYYCHKMTRNNELLIGVLIF